ncbi:DUF5597 domain-containing protein, partial [Bacteroides cellulosilyticus]
GIVIEFEKATENQAKVRALGEDGFAQAGGKGEGVISDKVMWKGARCDIGSVDEVKVNEDGTLSYIRRLNGDQDHQGRHVRIHHKPHILTCPATHVQAFTSFWIIIY